MTAKGNVMQNQEVIQAIEKHKIIVVLRDFTAQELLGAVSAMEKGGIRLVEVTFDQTGKTSDLQTAEHIRLLVDTFGDRMFIGAGTVMTENQVELAKQARARYIISPNTCQEIIEKTKALGLVSIPGAFTPTEAVNAHRYGADFVKLFPASEMNPSFIKAMTLPLSHIKFLAVGGITLDNLQEYASAGVKGFGIAAAIADKNAICHANFDEITARAKAFTDLL